MSTTKVTEISFRNTKDHMPKKSKNDSTTNQINLETSNKLQMIRFFFKACACYFYISSK